jgi:sugar-specific transcriptional regulator TrmB
MTQEWMLKTLVELGFSQQEAEVYLLLRCGPRKVLDISNELKIYKRKVYRIVKRLKETKIIQAKPTKPTQFQIVPFDNFLDLLINDCLSEADLLERRKAKLLANWKSIIRKIDFDNDV